ncbi:hypothetical protein M2306_001018 [Myroides gitamensis]|nr:hypothetical protein [Myroides odoratus]MDH6600324.1 hypothetical protein [Myroides gitamensis]
MVVAMYLKVVYRQWSSKEERSESKATTVRINNCGLKYYFFTLN